MGASDYLPRASGQGSSAKGGQQAVLQLFRQSSKPAEKAETLTMDSFELNKIIGAILGTLLFVMGVGFLAEAVYHPLEGRGPGYPLPEPEGTSVASAGPVEAAVPLGVLLASANVEQGATAVRKCQSCHNFAEGAGNKQGPELFDVVGRLIGSHPGFSYSPGMEEHKTKGDTWTYENLDGFLTSPKGFTPGTKMNFGGVKSAEERANILAYLQTLSPAPVPFPVAEAAPATDAAAPAAAAPAADAAAPGANAPAVPADTAPADAAPTTEAAPPAPAATEPAPPATH